ncbi:MAG: family 20 glycosylhydrolase, partial [Clostridia bacterium]|nr:family 20 glycosylhydrolase [Clostridia bacterium]
HAAAMLAAYPQFGCRRGKTGVWEEKVEISGGIFPALVCAGKEETLGFLKDILDEVTELFPFPAVHIGADEALKFRWRRCPDCQRRMRERGLQSEDDLQRHLLIQIGEYLAGKGRKTIVWNDVLAGGTLPPHFIVQQWTGGREETRVFMKNGGTVIRSDTDSFYLDYGYGRIDVRRIRETPRVPEYARGLEGQILGVECPLWTERVSSLERAAWQLFPRLTAVSVRMSGEDLAPEVFREKVKALETELEAKTGLKGAPEELWDMDPDAAEADREAEAQTILSGKAEAYERKGQRIVSLDAAERLAESLGIDRTFVQKGGDSVWAEVHGRAVPEDDDGAGILIRQLMIAADSRKYGAWKDITEAIWMDTMKCFPRFISEHRRSYGRDGFDRYGWTTRQIGAKLFRIGELEYELTEDKEGRKEIGLHIPSDAKLEAERMNASLQEADRFILERFPE